MNPLIKTINYRLLTLLVMSLLLPIQALHAGGVGGAITNSPTADTEPNSSSIPNTTPDFTTETRTSDTGKILTCVSDIGDPECAGAGNPINVITGNKYQYETDMAALPGIMGLSIERHYNSLHMGLGQIGYGWRLNYETNLYLIDNTIQIIKPDGSRVIFNRSILNPNDCACQNPAQGHVMIYPGNKGNEYTWFQLDGKQLHFNHQGKLERISAPTGERVQLTRGLKGELLKVTDPQGRSLVMHYADKHSNGFKGIVAIDSPVGRYEYQHNNDPESPGISNLILVRKPAANNTTANKDKLEQHYHYGETAYVATNMAAPSQYPAIPQVAHLLTGISYTWHEPNPKDRTNTITKTKRYRTWAYDKLGRGILSVHGYPKQQDANGKHIPNSGMQQVKIEYQLTAPKTVNNKPYPRITRNGEIGKTIITNSLGQQTHYTYTLIAGEYRLKTVIGAGCSECGETNIAYGYDKLGRFSHVTKVKAQKNAAGKTSLLGLHTTQTEYDSVGRIKRVADIAYINGKAQTPTLRVRYEYPHTPIFPRALKNAINAAQETIEVASQPSLIAKPSVIKGKEHQIHITYNHLGQALKVTETGYSPAIPESAEKRVSAYTGDIKKLSRTTIYTYKQINNRSLLAQMDGPLPNGKTNSPQDSDITQYTYDKRGQYLTQIIAPNNIVTKLAYDLLGTKETSADVGGSGRVVKVNAHNGIGTHYTYSPLGKVIATTRYPTSLTASAAKAQGLIQTTAMAYDVFGYTTMIKRADGQAIHMQYDFDGKLTSVKDGLGNRVEWKNWDTAQNKAGETVTTQQWYTADAPDTVARAWYFWRDDQNRLTQRLSPDGGLDTWRYSDAQTSQVGQPQPAKNQWVQHIDPLNRMTLNALSSQGSAQVRMTPTGYLDASFTLQASLGKASKTTAQKQLQIVDDFGRAISFSSAQHGTHAAQYNAANRITHILQPDGTKIDYTYDVGGRVLTKTAHALKPNTNNVVSYSYNAFGLSQVKDGIQTITYKQDSLGREIDKATTLNLKTGLTKTYHIHTRYTVDGKVKAKQLIDGDWLVFNLDKQTGLTKAMTIHSTIWPSVTNKLANWFNLPDLPLQVATKRAVVSNITAHPFNGITHISHGNGISDDYAFDLAGRLTSVSHGQHLQDSKANRPLIKASYTYDAGKRLTSAQISTADIQGRVQEYAYRGWNDFSTPPKSGFIKAVASTRNRDNVDARANKARFTHADMAETTLDQAGRTTADKHNRYQYNVWGKLASVQNKTNQQTIASYQSNALGERVMASYSNTINNKQANTSQTRYYLYDKQQRIAELDEQGNVLQQYLYINQTPVAVINTPTEQSQESDNQSTAGIIAIHTDRRHAPMMATDEQGKVIWQAEYDAWGKVTPVSLQAHGLSGTLGNPKQNNQANKFNLALRLPGQWQDQATGLYYNYQRDYNPDTGRYLTPDPLGFPDGADPYAYVKNDPLNKLDPLGLYSVNVHYYMTFFLGVAAGVSPEEARVIALGTQYIDDNPITQPLPEGYIDPVTSVILDNAAAVERLEKYHFTQAGYDPERKRYEYHPTPEERATAIRNGYPDPGPVTVHYESDSDYEKRRVKNPSNPQLDRLLGASNKSPSRCAKLQFFGEYLHAFEDTFAHRDQDNEPINVNMGLGHFGYWTNPDYTYDRWGIHPIWPLVHYDTNASRTLEMEKEVFAQMKQWSTGPDMISAGKITEENFYKLLDKFNKQKKSDEQIGILQEALDKWFGKNVIKLSGKGANYAYTNTEGQKNRNKYLCGLKQSDFEGTILPNDC